MAKAFNSFEEELLNISSGRSHSNTRGERSDMLSYCDLVNYITDVSVTIHTFMANYPPACEVFHQNGVLLRIPTFYELVFPTIEKEITRNENIKQESLLENIKRKLILSKTSFLKVFRDVLNYTCIQNILNYELSNKDEKICASTLVENYFEILTELILNKNFLCDYNLLYPFEGDLELFSELGINVDSERVNYIFYSIHDTEDFPTETYTSSAVNGARPKVKNNVESVQKPATNLQDLADLLRDKKEEENSYTNDSSLVCTPSKPSEIEIDSLIQSVLDLLPDYGEGFIEKCLDHYAYDKDKVIDALLTQELPNDIVCLDQNMKRQPNVVAAQDSYSVLSERKNIFDNDEFDVFSGNDINMKNIHKGKKNKTPTTYESLEKDTDSEFLKQLTIAAGFEDLDSEFSTQANLYEDEYDDTYDSSMVGLKEPAIEDVPEDDSSDDAENEENGRRPKPGDFCIDPQILRDRAEQRRLSRGGFNNRNRGNSRPTDDSHSRQQKDRHKSQVSNHNRRKQSDFKKSRGMFH